MSGAGAPRVLVIGAAGGIGSAVVCDWLEQGAEVYAVSRAPTAPVVVQARAQVAATDTDPPATAEAGPNRLHWLQCDTGDVLQAQPLIERCVAAIPGPLQRVVICCGTLQGPTYSPEKALARLQPAAMQQVYMINAVLPMLWLAALEPLLRRADAAVVAVLSARVGSIGDNRLGGWYSYRASKAALNMLLRTAAVELARRAPGVKLLAFHPGTTDTALSAPFQARVPEHRLFAPEFVASRLRIVMTAARADGELGFLDWDAQPVPW